MKNFKKPNLFIVGAPKCGTSSLSEYLRYHPDIYISTPKEPSYFTTDFSENFRNFNSDELYLKKCFSGAGEEVAVGEATVWYLYSDEAVPNILEFNPNSKFIVMVRNPVEMAYSLHSQLVTSFDEDVISFKDAWGLQGKRKAGRKIPLSCRDPQLLKYGKVCNLGSQVERLFEKVPTEKVHVIVFDDFVEDTRGAYKKTLNFLGVKDDGREHFPVVNSSELVNNRFIHELSQFLKVSVYPHVRKLSSALKRLSNVESWNIISSLREKSLKEAGRKPLDPEFSEELRGYFREDVELLSELLDRDLTHWVK